MIESRKDNPKIYSSGVRLPVQHQLTGFTIPQLAEILNEAQEKKEMNEAVLLSTDDWEMLYINGKIVDEGHTLNEGESRIKYMLNLSNVHNFDLSEMKDGSSFNVDTPLGGLGLLYDSHGNVTGLSISGPSAGYSISGYGPGISLGD